jgi:hypothetical protein
VFFDPVAARTAGLPGTIVPGPLKLALLSEWVREWAGPDGFLESIRIAHRRPDQPDRALALQGSVSRITETETGRRLECEVWLKQVSGERSAVGAAVVRLGPA